MAHWTDDPSLYASTEDQPVTPKSHWTDDPSLYATPGKRPATQEDKDAPITSHDVYDALASGWHGAGANLYSLAAGASSSPNFRDWALRNAQAKEQKAGEAVEDMSAGAQEASQAGIMDGSILHNPIRNLVIQGAQQAPAFAGLAAITAATGGVGGLMTGGAEATAAEAGLTGRALTQAVATAATRGRTIGAGVGGSLGFGAQNAGALVQDFADGIRNLPDDQLQYLPGAPERLKLMTPNDFKNWYIDNNVRRVAAEGGAIGAIAGAALEAGSIFSKAERGIVNHVLTGGVSFGGAGIATEAATQKELGQGYSPSKIASAGVSQAIFGAALGSLGGMRGSKEDKPKPGKQSSKGSERNYPKDEAASAGSGKEPPPESGEPPPPAGVDAAQEAALAPESKGAKTKAKAQAKQQSTPGDSTTPPSDIAGKPPEPPPAAPPASAQAAPPSEPTPRAPSSAGPFPPTSEPPATKPGEAPPEAAAPFTPTSKPPATPPGEAPSEAPNPSVKEAPQTLHIQHEALLNGQKKAVLYPRGEGVVPIPEGTKGVKEHTFTDGPNKGDVLQYRSLGKNSTNITRIKDAYSKGKLHEILDYAAPTEEVQKRVDAGEQPAVTVERTPDGTEARAANTTAETAPEQVKQFEETKLAPENTVSVESGVEGIVADRVANAEAPPLPAAETSEAPKTAGDKLKDFLAGRQDTTPTAGEKVKEKVGGKNFSKKERAERVRNNSEAAKIYDKSTPGENDSKALDTKLEGGKEARAGLLARVSAALDAAKEAKIKIPETLKKFTDETMNHHPGVLWLNEAQRFANQFINNVKNSKSNKQVVESFLARETMIRGGKIDEFLADRKSEAASKKEAIGTSSKKGESAEDRPEEAGGVSLGEEAVAVTPESMQEGTAARAAAEARAKKAEAIQAELDRRAEEKRKREEETAAQIEKEVAEREAKAKEAKTVTVETRGRRTVDPASASAALQRLKEQTEKRKEEAGGKAAPLTKKLDEKAPERKILKAEEPEKPVEEARPEKPKGYKEEPPVVSPMSLARGSDKERQDEGLTSVIETHTLEGKEILISPLETTTAGKALSQFVNLKKYSPSMRPIMGKLLARLKALVSDIPFHIVSDEGMETLNNGALSMVGGLYDHKLDHVLLNTELPQHLLTHATLHECFHAATSIGIRSNPQLRVLNARLFNEIRDAILMRFGGIAKVPDELRYGLTSPEEMLTEIHASDAWQKEVKTIRISGALAHDLSMPKWRRGTMYNGFLELFRRALGLGAHDYNAMEAALNIGEKAMHSKDNMERVAYDLRSHTREPDGGVSPMLYSQSVKSVNDNIREKIKDISPAARTVTAAFRKIFDAPSDWAVRAQEKGWAIAHHAANWIDKMQQISALRKDTLKKTDPLMGRLARMQNENRAEFDKLGDLLVSSTIHGADARHDLGTGKNSHIKPNKTKIEDSNLEHREAILGNPKDRVAYKELHPDTQSLYNEVMDTISDMTTREAKAARKSLGERFDNDSTLPQEVKDVIQKLIDRKDLTDEEREKYGSHPMVKELRDFDRETARASLNAYFPLHRLEGSHVITGEHDYQIPAGATRGSNDPTSPDYHRIIFNDRREAFHFDPDLHSDINIKHYLEDAGGNRQYTIPPDPANPESKERPVGPSEAKSNTGLKYGQEYHVSVNNRDVRIVDGRIAGERMREQMEKEGVKNISQVSPIKNKEIWQFGVSSAQITAIMNRLDKMGHLTDSDRQEMKDAISHVAAASMPGSRMSRAHLHRDKTGGAGLDMLRTLDQFRRASASREAMSTHRVGIDASLEAMRKYVDENRGHKDHDSMEQMVQQFNERTNTFHQDSIDDINMNKWWARAQSYSTLIHLVSPAFLFLHQLHIPLTVLPDLAAKHGVGTASRIALGVYSQMLGKELPIALRAMGKAVTSSWKYDHAPTDFLDALIKETKISDTEKSLFKYLESRDLIHNTGIDFTHSFGTATAMDKLAVKSRNFSQEFIGAAETFNRFGSALMYYRAALEKGMSHDEACKYVGEAITRTQGQFASFNRMGAFKDPRARAILQYKQYPVLMMKMIGKAMYNSFAPGVEWETRAHALKTFALMTGSATAMSGVQGGAAYPIRMVDDLAHQLGLTEGWPAHMDKLHRALAEEFGPTGANIAMHGLGGGLTGVHFGHRGGTSDPLGLNQTMEMARGSKDFYQWMAGPPAGLADSALKSVSAAMQGDVKGILMNLGPRVLTDPIKGYQELTQGVTTQKGKVTSSPLSVWDAFLKSMGFTTTTETNVREARAAVGGEKAKQNEERSKVFKLWQNNDRAKALAAAHKFNEKYPDSRITTKSLQNSLKPTLLGYPETPKNRKDLEDRAAAYGIRQ